MKVILSLFLFAISFSAIGCGNVGNKGSSMNEIFTDLENAIKNEDESLFKKHWDSEGYSTDLVGEGLTGERFYQQGSRKKWFPKPNLDEKEVIGKVEIVPTKLYSWEKDKNVDEIYFAIAAGKILGGGENLEKVRALADKYK